MPTATKKSNTSTHTKKQSAKKQDSKKKSD